MLVPELDSRFGANSGRRAKRFFGCTTFSTPIVVSVAETRGRDSGRLRLREASASEPLQKYRNEIRQLG
jgi:hypothetical protein